MSNSEKLISRLEGVIRRDPDKWYARCPAHEDKSPSLSVTDTGEKILVHCFAGCSVEDVLTAVGLAWTDLYPDRWRASHEATTHAKPPKPLEFDPMEVERWVLRIAAARIDRGEILTVEDEARIEVARLRLRVAKREAA